MKIKETSWTRGRLEFLIKRGCRAPKTAKFGSKTNKPLKKSLEPQKHNLKFGRHAAYIFFLLRSLIDFDMSSLSLQFGSKLGAKTS